MRLFTGPEEVTVYVAPVRYAISGTGSDYSAHRGEQPSFEPRESFEINTGLPEDALPVSTVVLVSRSVLSPVVFPRADRCATLVRDLWTMKQAN